MPTTPDPKQELSSTYMVQDRSSQEEMARLQKQDQLLTSYMGGVLAEQSDPASLRRVLDIGCGTGGWLLETARTYPDITLLIGVDISHHMVHFARAQAASQQLSERVEFHVMDALRMLEFPNNYFDLVNVRTAMSYLRTWDWPKFLEECQRVSKPDGVVRITEGGLSPSSTSAALTRLHDLSREAFYRAGHLFTPEGDSVMRELPTLLERFRFQNVQTREHKNTVQKSSDEWQLRNDDMRLLFRNIVPFLQKWTRIPDDYQELYQQMLAEIQQPDFQLTGMILTAWGITPSE